MKKESNLAIFIGLILAHAYWAYALTVGRDLALGVNQLGNIKTYVIFISLFTVSFLLSFLIFYWRKVQLSSKTASRVLSITCIILFGIMSYQAIRLYAPIWKGSIWKIAVISLSLLISISIWAGVNYFQGFQGKIKEYAVIALSCLFVAISWYKCVETCNIFIHTDRFGTLYNVHHSSAYIDSIYAVFHNVPYRGGVTDQYGHYGLFLAPFLKLLGARVYTISKLLGLIAALAAVLFIYAGFKSIKKPVIRFLLIVLLAFAGVIPVVYNIYWQTYPHRIIMLAVITAYILFMSNRKMTIKYIVIGGVLCTLGLIWSNDSGLVALGCWGIYVFTRVFILKGADLAGIAKGLGVSILTVILSILLASGIINVYNTITGGNVLGFLSLMGLDTPGYFNKLGASDLGFWDVNHSVKLILFMICLAWSFVAIKEEDKEQCSPAYHLAFASSFIGLGMSTYYIHNTRAGNETTNIFLVMCVLCYLEMFEKKNDLKNGFSETFSFSTACLATVVLSMVLINYVYQSGEVTDKYFSKTYDYDIYEGYVKEVAEEIEEDTVGVGIGTSAIFLEMGRDRGTYRFDEEDIIYIYENKPDSFIVWRGYEDSYEGYRKVKSFKFDQERWDYYKRIEEH